MILLRADKDLIICCKFLRYMSHVVRKPAFCICDNKDADQLRSDCAARFLSDMVGNPEDRFSHNEAHIMVMQNRFVSTKMYMYM